MLDLPRLWGKITDRQVFAVLVLFLLFLSSFTLVFAQVQTADIKSGASSSASSSASQATSAGQAGGVTYCKGYDWGLLESSVLKRCGQFKDKVLEYYQKHDLESLGVDPLQLFVMMYRESGCRTREQMTAYDERRGSHTYSTWQGGPFQVDDPCYYSYLKKKGYAKDECPTLDIQLEEGIKEFKQKFLGIKKRAERLGVNLNPDQTTWMVWFSYNRGLGAGGRALRNMAKGMDIREATDESCRHYYAKREKGYKFYCTHSGSLGIQYAGRLWDTYKEACSQMGGSLTSGDGVKFASLAQAGVSGAGVSPSAAARPNHPAFSVPYSVDPSFRTRIPYDLSIFENISSKLASLERCRADLYCLDGNITLIEKSMPEFNWIGKSGGNIFTTESNSFLPSFKASELYAYEQFCEPPNLNAVTSLAEAVTECLRSADRGCVCRYDIPLDPPEKEGTLRKVGRAIGLGSFMDPPPKFEYRDIKFENRGGDVVLTLLHPSDSDVRPQTINNAYLVDIDSSLRDGFARMMGKGDVLSYDADDYAKSIDIYKHGSQNFSLYFSGESSAEDKKCRLSNRVVKFCIVHEDRFLAYDKKKNTFGLLNMALKFGYFFRSKVQEVKNFVISDAPLAQNTSLLSWDEPITGDVAQFNIYIFNSSVSQKSLEGKSTEDIVNDPDLIKSFDKVEVFVSSRQDISDMSWPLKPICELSGRTCDVVYGVLSKVQGQQQTVSLAEDTLYFISSDDKRKYFYLRSGVNDGEVLNYAITAVDTQGDESPTLSWPEQGKYEKPVDDLPPALPEFSVESSPGQFHVSVHPPVMNLDGSPLDASELKWFRAYCFSPDVSEFDLSSKAPVKTIEVEKTGDMYIDNPLCGAPNLPGTQVIVTAVDKNNQEFRQKIAVPSLSQSVAFKAKE